MVKKNNPEDYKGHLLHCLLFRLGSASLQYRPNHRPAKVTNTLYSFLDLSGRENVSHGSERQPTLGAELSKVAIFIKRNTTETKHTTFERVLSSRQTIVRFNAVLHIRD